MKGDIWGMLFIGGIFFPQQLFETGAATEKRDDGQKEEAG